MSLYIKNVLINNDSENSVDKLVNVLIIDGKISSITNNNEENKIDFDEHTKVLDGMGKYLLPGMIDMNCEVCVPGYEYKEDMQSISKSAAKSGFTSLTCNPNTNPIIDNKIVVKYISQSAIDDAFVNIYPYGHMSKGGDGKEISEIGEMYNNGVVAISDGNISISDDYLLMNIFTYSKMFNMPIITFCENQIIRNKGMVNKGLASMLTGLNGISKSAEEVYVARNIILAKETGARIHITKVSTSGSVELIRLAKFDGVNITCDTCPHYICYTEEKVTNYGTYYKVSPPLRTSNDNKAIINGLKDGTIDAISTGHSPENIETKNREFEAASFGLSGIEPSFLVCYNYLVKTGHLSLNQLLSKMSYNPYNILHIKGKGLIEVGYDADLFIFDDKEMSIINENKFETKAKYSMYNNTKLTGAITHTIVNGNIVFESL